MSYSHIRYELFHEEGEMYDGSEPAFYEPEGLWIREMYNRFKAYMQTEKQIEEEKKRKKGKKTKYTAKDLRRMSEEELHHFFDVPNYDENYWWKEGFSYSFDYFDDLFWSLIELAVLGTPDASSFARYELCDLMYIEPELVGQITEDDLEIDDSTTNNSDDGESLVADFIEKKPVEEMSSTERNNLFSILLDRAMDHQKKAYGKFTATDLFHDRLGKNPVVFSRIRSGARGTSPDMLLRIGVGLELSCTDMQILFKAKGWSFPSNPHEKIISDGINKGLSWKSLMKLIPPEKESR